MSTDALTPAITALQQGRPALVLDDADRENEGDAILAGETLTAEWMGWLVRHSSGYVCAPMPADRADQLGLPPMVAQNEDSYRTAYTITADAASGVTTGISATDRARTVQVLADPAAGAEDLIRPGHMVPLRARPGGVLERPGHTEAAVDLCRIAGLTPVAAIAELVDDRGRMLRGPQVRELASQFDLPVLTVAEIAAWRREHDRITPVATTRMPTDAGTFIVRAYTDRLTGAEHLALVPESEPPARDPLRAPLVRVHSECYTGEVLGSRRCDCGAQLQEALRRVAHEGGAVIYLRGQEGRGVGLVNKLRAYQAQDAGLDTIEAQQHLGLPVDAREYGAAVAILDDLGIGCLRLLTHNPDKVAALREGGIAVAGTEPSRIHPAAEATTYLETKRTRMGHATLPAAAVPQTEDA